MENTMEQPEPLAVNPVETIMQTITDVETTAQSVNVEEEIAATIGVINNLVDTGSVEADRAAEHMTAQLVNETQASSSYATAENAQTENTYFASASKGDLHQAEATHHNVLSHSAEVTSEASMMKAAALEQVATVQYAIQEQSERVVAGQVEVENRTTAAIEQEMKITQAVAEDAAMDNNLEAELVATAELASPKV